MKLRIGFIFLTAIILMFGLKCTDEPESRPSHIGYWYLPITPIPEILPDTMNIILDINENATFHLELNQQSEKVLFEGEGDWETRGDSIVLYGDECMILNTVPDPDTLVSLSDSLCKAPITLNLPEDTKTWKIRTSSLALVLSAFPIDKTKIDFFLEFVPLITLTKEEE